MAVLVCLVFAAAIFSYGREDEVSVPQLMACLFGGILIPLGLTALVELKCMEQGRYLVLLAVLLTFVTDAAAYFVGKAFGKHKLAPVISPKKTIEGAVGGVIATVLLLEVYALILDKAFGFDVIYGYGILYGILGSTISILGDLTFSVIKRQVGIKDYGNLIPGHGGALDRFDSMILVAPATEILLLMLPMAVPMAGVG